MTTWRSCVFVPPGASGDDDTSSRRQENTPGANGFTEHLDSPLMSFVKTSQPIKTYIVEAIAPCDKDCWFAHKCKREKLACREFEQFVLYGVQRDPPKTVPTRARYERIFRAKKKGRPRKR